MSIDVLQILYYVGFAALGWWLRHQGFIAPGPTPTPTPTPAPLDQGTLIELLKTLLDRLAAPSKPAPLATPPATGNVVHVPIEVAANVKQPSV
jgi:hypothetical protein